MKVLLVLSDGMRSDVVEGHPVVHYLMENGTYCLRSRTVMPSCTLPCHMSLFHSVDPSRHGITTNTYVPQVRPVPGLFEQIKAAKKYSAMFYNWEELRDLARPGNLRYSEYVSNDVIGSSGAARKSFETAREYLKKEDIDFAFLYFGWPDCKGHGNGWLSPEYRNAVNGCCDMVGELIREFGDEYVIFYTADHGGHDQTHGTACDEDMTIPIFCLGGPFARGKAVEGLSIMDIAPTIASILGVEIPREWEGKIIR